MGIAKVDRFRGESVKEPAPPLLALDETGAMQLGHVCRNGGRREAENLHQFADAQLAGHEQAERTQPVRIPHGPINCD